jgi:hypothetical protein
MDFGEFEAEKLPPTNMVEFSELTSFGSPTPSTAALLTPILLPPPPIATALSAEALTGVIVASGVGQGARGAMGGHKTAVAIAVADAGTGTVAVAVAVSIPVAVASAGAVAIVVAIAVASAVAVAVAIAVAVAVAAAAAFSEIGGGGWDANDGAVVGTGDIVCDCAGAVEGDAIRGSFAGNFVGGVICSNVCGTADKVKGTSLPTLPFSLGTPAEKNWLNRPPPH